MKRVLIATTNSDKFNAVCKIFRATIFPAEEYEIESLRSINAVLEDRKEKGNNIQRAAQKALDAFEQLGDLGFDYIVGLDDAMRVRGELEPNIKMYVSKILAGELLVDGEQYSFCRAYAFLSGDGKSMQTITADIPYVYHALKADDDVRNAYPLDKVSYPIGYDKAIAYLDEASEVEYYLRYVKDAMARFELGRA